MQVPEGISTRYTKKGQPRYCVKVYDRALRRQRWVGTFKRLSDAIAARSEALGVNGLTGAASVKEYFDFWCSNHNWNDEATLERYRSSLATFVRDFGRRAMHTIRRPEAIAWAAQQPLSASDTVRTFLNDAKDDGVLLVNPFEKLGRKRSRGRKDLNIISTDELKYLKATAEDVWPGPVGIVMSSMIEWAAKTASRPAEIFATQWSWIDFDAGELALVGQRDRHGKLKPLKNKDQRVVALLDGTDVIRRIPRRRDDGTVFHSARGGAFTESKLHYYWNPIRVAFGRPEMAFYELRHYCATLLLEAGASPFDVSIHLGHVDGGKLVMDTYGHPSEERARQRLKKLDLSMGIRRSRSAGFRPPEESK